ncbi:hypothetical protein BVRB_8g196880 [Beta vulgaris subsp. vulgaris]|nr:hypothetical protein BVRB_8g196870 [Beta vulgaris subsp. vulgaris]KMT03131.1 hypothetical protein BVRB_8g196880 [Beta vulgaris subsp. vulgaris]
MATSNNITLAIVLVIGLTISHSQLCWAKISPDWLRALRKNPNIDPNTPLSDLLTGKVNPSNNKPNPVKAPVVDKAVKNVVNPVTRPVGNAAKKVVNPSVNPDVLPENPNDFLIPQNAARAKVHVQPFIWNETLAEFARSYAQERANDCKLQHSHAPQKGENIARSPGVLTAAKAVEMWLGEEPNYNAASNTCNKVCGHYTQVVWRDSTSIGCARSNCQNRGTFVTCNYYPPGNYIGRRPF